MHALLTLQWTEDTLSLSMQAPYQLTHGVFHGLRDLHCWWFDCSNDTHRLPSSHATASLLDPHSRDVIEYTRQVCMKVAMLMALPFDI